MPETTDQPITNSQVIAQWAASAQASLATFSEEGDFARQYLLNPTLFALLGNVQNKTILDAGCGNGYLSRLLAKRGAVVTGVEPALYSLAIQWEQADPLGITYLKEDLSVVLAHRPHLQNSFDIVIANVVLQDIPDCDAALATCLNSLKPGGDFIFSILHPCFEDSSNAWAETGCVCVAEYFEHRPVPQARFGYFFHRPLSYYFNTVITKGGQILRVIEPQLSEDFSALGRAYERDKHVPSFLVIHARRKV